MRGAYGYRAFGGPEVQEFVERPDPVPAPHEVAVAVRAAGVNPIDHALRSGMLPMLNGGLPFPQVLGVEAAGVVTAVGADVSGLEVGDQVFGFALTGAGTYAHRTVLLGSTTARTPDGLSDIWAATIPVAGTTALDVLDQLDLAPGDRILVNGIGGGVGVATAQLARARGLEVVGTGSTSKRALATSAGASFVDYTQGPVEERLRALAPEGFAGVVDLVGGASLRAVAPLAVEPARVVAVGDPTVVEIGGAMPERHTDRATLERVAALMVQGVLDPTVTTVVPLSGAGEALLEVESGHSIGKTVLDLTL
ncbi:NADP-dependent oxidoreductase [Actinomycetospora atypica]|uniref:NADP-dependent oxidoreductase n=1 Tax=Actinomycetospora atypica TaxID=1290095 RepID=A0ABV9YQB5_9PSEU